MRLGFMRVERVKTYASRIAVAGLLFVTGATRSMAQDDVRRLFESGKYQGVVEQAADDSPSAQYLKGLAHLKLDQADDAKSAFRRLEGADEAWRSVGQSAVALTDGNA